MRELTQAQDEVLKISIKPSVVLLFMTFLFMVATLIVFRQQCVKEGYEISRLAAVLESKTANYERISTDYYEVLRRETLINKAEEMGFVFPEGGKVFYVWR